MNEKNIVPNQAIESKIFLIRGRKVMVDRDLAELYEVETKYLNRQVRRNLERFPEEFMFQLNQEESAELVTNCHRFKTMKHSSVFPLAFTEHGVAMLASVLKSKRAIKISIHIINTFVNLRRWTATHQKLAYQLGELAKRVDMHDREIRHVMKFIQELISSEEQPEPPKRRIGFHP